MPSNSASTPATREPEEQSTTTAPRPAEPAASPAPSTTEDRTERLPIPDARRRSDRRSQRREPPTRRRVRRVTVVIPVLNESRVVGDVIRAVDKAVVGHEDAVYELLVIDDGSNDGSADVARQHGARVVTHPYNIGNGGAIKSGIRHARGDFIVFMDGDGQHQPSYIPKMIDLLDDYHMVVGARRVSGQASIGRAIANGVYNRFATYITGFPIKDLTSGFRAVRARHVRRFTYLLPNTFSYPTTLTLATLRAGFSIRYLGIETNKRVGRSKIRPIKDGTRFLMIMLKITTLFAPLRIFLPLSASIFGLGVTYYVYTFLTEHRFTNMGVLLIVLSFLMFSLGLISEQIAQLRYDRSEG